jgi:hypothetical protein
VSNAFWSDLSAAVFGKAVPSYSVQGSGHLPSFYKVSDFAEASVGLAGVALARFWDGGADQVLVDRRLASLWFYMTLWADGWKASGLWDAIAGDYQCRDGWIRLHTNAPHHRDVALLVLGTKADRAAVAKAVLTWRGVELESAVVAAGGCGAQMRLPHDWAEHPQGRAIAAEPLVHWDDHGVCAPTAAPEGPSLRGLKVLDLTRVLAGPVATRFLAGFGADVLRIDPPFWNEPSVEMEVTLSKCCAGLDLRIETDLEHLKQLMREADVFVHGYRADALDRLGIGTEVRRELNPTLVDVRLNAYGWSGPWVNRRGFDSLVQMSCGIAGLGMELSGSDRPKPLPVQALDHGAGYLVAACILEALSARRKGRLKSAKVSLARVAHLLMANRCEWDTSGAIKQIPSDFNATVENTGWGPAHRVKAPLQINGVTPHWAIAAGPLRRHRAAW